MRLILTVLALILSNIPATLSELKLVIAYARHGARTAKKFEFKPKLYGELKPGELTLQGFNQALQVGELLRSKYIEEEGFLNKSAYSSSEIYIKSGEDQRCVFTAVGMIGGLYPQEFSQSFNMTNWIIGKEQGEAVMLFNTTTYPTGFPRTIRMSIQSRDESDLLFHGNSKRRCLRVRNSVKDLRKSDATEAIEETLMPIYPKVIEAVKNFSGVQLSADEIDLERVLEIYDAYKTNIYHDVMPRILPESVVKKLETARNHEMEYLKLGDDDLKTTAVSELYKETAAFLRRTARNETREKFVLYSGHEHNLMGVLITLLNKKEYSGLKERVPGFASTILLEVHDEKKHGLIVKVFYNYKELKLKKCAGYSTVCKLKDFIDLLEDNVIYNLREWCNRY